MMSMIYSKVVTAQPGEVLETGGTGQSGLGTLLEWITSETPLESLSALSV